MRFVEETDGKSFVQVNDGTKKEEKEYTPRGKELLDKQLKNIREKKNKIIEEANKETELFKKFQIATQANPNLTYAEFIKTINGK